jgi:ABC-type transporter MlaC component
MLRRCQLVGTFSVTEVYCDDSPFAQVHQLTSCPSLLVGTVRAIADAGPAEFVRTLSNEAPLFVPTRRSLKRKSFSPAKQQDFNIPRVTQSVLGPYRRIASEPERWEFRRFFEEYVVEVCRL